MFKIGERVRLKKFEDIENDHSINDETLGRYCGTFVTIEHRSVNNGLSWYCIEETNYSWCEDMFETHSKTEVIDYIFWDDKINIHQLCQDSLESDMKGFIVMGKGKGFIGILESDLVISSEGRSIDVTGEGHPYTLAVIDLKDVGFWRKKLLKYADDFKVWRAGLDENIRDRGRDKGEKSKFRVLGF